MTANPAVLTKNISKKFSDIQAVNKINLNVSTGKIFSLLGPNGAGKSTLISILSCLVKPTDGKAWVLGHSVSDDPLGVKKSLGVVPQEIALYGDLSARENLAFWGKMYGLRGQTLSARVDSILEIIGLTERQNDRVSTYSGGMKRRVNIGAALVHEPDLIIMDEPTVGIDPQSRRHILNSIKNLNDLGMTVFYTTHYMEEAQELSDRIAIMDRGQIIADGTHDQLVKIVGELDRIDLQINQESNLILERWKRTSGVKKISAENGTITLLTEDSNLVLPELFQQAAAADVRITSVDIQEPNLEAVFLHLTGRVLRD